MCEKANDLNIAAWEDAIRDGFAATYAAYRDIASDGVYVHRPDGSIVWVGYYWRSKLFAATRLRANGKLGALKFYSEEENGWLRALNHRLPVDFQE